MCRGSQSQILLYLHTQLEKTVLLRSLAGQRFGCRNHPSGAYGLWTLESWISRLRGHPEGPIAFSQMLDGRGEDH